MAAIFLGRYARKLRAVLAGHSAAAVQAFRALRAFWVGLALTYAATFVVSVLHLALELAER
jgi:hypothetical protein